MPAHYLIYMEICVLILNILKIDPKGMATFKKIVLFQAEGVRVFILLYKEFQLALSLNSFYSKRTLMTRGGRNIKVNIVLTDYEIFTAKEH